MLLEILYISFFDIIIYPLFAESAHNLHAAVQCHAQPRANHSFAELSVYTL